MATKAVKVSSTTPETAQLEVFVNNLGVEQKAEIYLYNKQAFINAEIILPLLSVDQKWFIKNAESTVHYIIIKKRLFVNKYGLTKLLAQSKEAVAFQLQDYIYEVIYKLETTGSVAISDISSRNDLVKTLTELDVYKSTEARNQTVLRETEDELRILQNDYIATEQQLGKVTELYDNLLSEHYALTKEHNALKLISKKLASYVKLQSSKSTAKDKILEELYDIEEVDDEADVDIDDMKKQAIQAKQELVKINKSLPKKKKPVDQNELKQYYIMRSSDSTFARDTDEELYKWSIVSELPGEEIKILDETYTDFKKFSQDYALGDISQTTYEYIWYCDITLTATFNQLLTKIFNILPYISEQSVLQILKTIT
jgi:hypothetical protein